MTIIGLILHKKTKKLMIISDTLLVTQNQASVNTIPDQLPFNILDGNENLDDFYFASFTQKTHILDKRIAISFAGNFRCVSNFICDLEEYIEIKRSIRKIMNKIQELYNQYFYEYRKKKHLRTDIIIVYRVSNAIKYKTIGDFNRFDNKEYRIIYSKGKSARYFNEYLQHCLNNKKKIYLKPEEVGFSLERLDFIKDFEPIIELSLRIITHLIFHDLYDLRGIECYIGGSFQLTYITNKKFQTIPYMTNIIGKIPLKKDINLFSSDIKPLIIDKYQFLISFNIQPTQKYRDINIRNTPNSFQFKFFIHRPLNIPSYMMSDVEKQLKAELKHRINSLEMIPFKQELNMEMYSTKFHYSDEGFYKPSCAGFTVFYYDTQYKLFIDEKDIIKFIKMCNKSCKLRDNCFFVQKNDCELP